jgi:FkbM family methyltransferase
VPEYDRIEYHGLKFDCRVGTSDEKSVNEVVLRRGYKRRDFTVEEHETWIDLGANIGAFTVWAASLGARVVAYEPDPESVAMIKHNVKLNGLGRRVVIVQAAVTADDRASATLHRNTARGNVWRNSIERSWRGGEDITVPCANVAELWTPNANIKMDIEGTEMAILENYGTIAVNKLAFEWSFDVDPSIPRFQAVIATLKGRYDSVHYGGFDESYDEWQPSWFPPCRVVWCQ